MSRLYGRSFDVFKISHYLEDSKFDKYKKDKRKTTWEELTMSPEIVDLYLPEKAKDFLSKNPIRIVHSPLCIKESSLLPKDGEEPTMFLPRIRPIEEYKRELIFFVGTLLSSYSPDEMPKNDDLPCEYNDVLALLLEYLYLKETCNLDKFSAKHLDELKYNAKHFVPSYESYQKSLINDKQLELCNVSYDAIKKYEERTKNREQLFLNSTLSCLISMSSMDAVLQITDKIEDKESIKQLIDQLFNNEDNNRQELLKNYGIESYGYNRLRKEIDRRKK